jgi:hypothetical protein
MRVEIDGKDVTDEVDFSATSGIVSIPFPVPRGSKVTVSGRPAREFRFGDIVKWRDDLGDEPEPIGRFMVISRYRDYSVMTVVTCLIAVEDSDWEIGLTMLVETKQLTLA